MRPIAVFAWIVLTLIGLSPASAEKRVALVIGNGAYQKVAKLPNPVRDAAAMANLFRAVGFDTVQVKSDLDVSSMRRALRDFSELVRDADIAVVFFAGHGIEVGGTNYLIPVDAALERDLDVEDETVSLDRVNQILEPAKRLRMIVLDACRDNPFASGIRRTLASRSIGRGLARVDVAAADSMVAFAAKPGSTAADGTGANSPYTTALLKHLATPGLDLRLAMGRVRDEVLAATGRRQEPIVFTSLGGAEVALVPGKAGAPVAAPPPDPAERAWAGVRDTASIAMLEEFRRQYPASPLAGFAGVRIEELKKSRVAAVAPPVTPALPPPQTPPPAAPSVAEMQRPIDNLFAAWRGLNVDSYVAQWAKDGVKYDLKAKTRKTAAELAAERRRYFPQLSGAEANFRPTFRGIQNGIGNFDVAYTLSLRYRSGRTFSESACESYKVRKDGGAWVIIENQDYKPC